MQQPFVLMYSFLSISRIAGPAQRPRIDKVHRTAVSSPRSGVSFCKVVVVAVGAVATAIAIAEWDGPCISCPNHGQSPEDRSDGQHVQDLFPLEGLVDQFRAALGDP